MKRLLCPALPQPGRPVPLPQAEADHAVRVLRLRDGDVVQALDGHGHAAIATLRVKAGPPRLEFRAEAPAVESGGAPVPLVLEAAVLKGDAMEWMIEKSVELGVARLVPVLTTHTVVQIKNKGPEAFQARWQKIADQALKQCGRLERLEIEAPVSLEALLTRNPCNEPAEPRLWFDEGARDRAPFLMDWLAERGTRLVRPRLLVGPEGGWSGDERDLMDRTAGKETHRLGLGPLVLRAETAALFSTSLVAAHLRSRHFAEAASAC